MYISSDVNLVWIIFKNIPAPPGGQAAHTIEIEPEDPVPQPTRPRPELPLSPLRLDFFSPLGDSRDSKIFESAQVGPCIDHFGQHKDVFDGLADPLALVGGSACAASPTRTTLPVVQ